MIDLKDIKFGAIPSPDDPRDWPARAAAPAAIPETIMLDMPPVADQGNVGDCVIQALRMAAQLGVPVVLFVTPVTVGMLDGYGVWHNNGQYKGSHAVIVAGCAPHCTGPATQNMAYGRNSWGADWGENGYFWMSWDDVFRLNEVWAIYPPELGTGKFGVDMGYGRWREHETPGLVVREALAGYAKEGIAPLKDDPNTTEVTKVITYAKVTNAERLLKAAAPYVGATYYRLASPDDVKAVLYEAYLKQQGKRDDDKEDNIVVKHTSLRLKDPYMRDKDTVTGSDVTLCQQRLTLHGHACGTVDGVFGPKCDAAARAFQTAKSLTVDGIVGVKTWAALEAEPDNDNTGSAYDIDAIEAMMELMVGDEYIIGGQGHELTKAYLDERRAAKPGYFDDTRYDWLVKRIALAAQMSRKLYCEDCSGILMHCNDVLHFWTDNDLSVASIYKKCAVIGRADLQPGDILFRAKDGEIVHMAWVGRKGIYEAAGIAYGVVFRTSADDRATLNRITGKIDTLDDWTDCGRPLAAINS